MKIVQVYNNYRSGGGGETVVVHATQALLADHGHEVRLIERDSRTVAGLPDKVRAFFGGVYSWRAKREMVDCLARERPDVVHAHNLYPLFSPSVLAAAREQGVPVVLSLHNFVLTCPTWAHLCRGAVCERCCGGREYWCVLKNCRDNGFESVGYALRSVVARRLRLFHTNVTVFVALSEFARRRLVEAGFDEERVVVLPNMVPVSDAPDAPDEGDYAAFAGRMSPEKGIETLLAAAERTGLPVKLAGDGPSRAALAQAAPANATFVGALDHDAMGAFYRKARFTVAPSIWFEMCPLVIGEAMGQGLPVIASRIGGLPELVEDEVTGLLFEPGDAEGLARQMQRLWDDPDLCRRLGTAGRDKARREYGEAAYYERLMDVYAQAVDKDRASTAPRARNGHGE